MPEVELARYVTSVPSGPAGMGRLIRAIRDFVPPCAGHTASQ
jgi:hypothetical protein